MFHNCEGQSHKTTTFEEKDSNRSRFEHRSFCLPAARPNSLTKLYIKNDPIYTVSEDVGCQTRSSLHSFPARASWMMDSQNCRPVNEKNEIAHNTFSINTKKFKD